MEEVVEEGWVKEPTAVEEMDEDTSDESFQKRHSKFENAEQNRMPLPIERRYSSCPVPEKPRSRKRGRRPSRDTHAQQLSPVTPDLHTPSLETLPEEGLALVGLPDTQVTTATTPPPPIPALEGDNIAPASQETPSLQGTAVLEVANDLEMAPALEQTSDSLNADGQENMPAIVEAS